MRGIYDMNLGALRMFYTRRPPYKNYNEIKNVVFRCDVVKDKDILDALSNVKLKSEYIKSLIRRGLKSEKAEKAAKEKEAVQANCENSQSEAVKTCADAKADSCGSEQAET